MTCTYRRLLCLVLRRDDWHVRTCRSTDARSAARPSRIRSMKGSPRERPLRRPRAAAVRARPRRRSIKQHSIPSRSCQSAGCHRRHRAPYTQTSNDCAPPRNSTVCPELTFNKMHCKTPWLSCGNGINVRDTHLWI